MTALAPGRAAPGPVGFGGCLRAELVSLRRRPGMLVLTAVWAVEVVAFAYVLLYVISRSSEPASAEDAERLLGFLLPASTGGFVVGSMPLYGGPLMLWIGALLAGGDYKLGTLATLLARYPRRGSFLLARFTGLLVGLLAVAALTLGLSVACSAAIAVAADRPLDYPSIGRLAVTLGALWLVAAAWGSLGFALGVLARGTMAAVGAGLLWTLGVETLLIGGLSGAVPVLDAVRVGLLAPSSGSLAAALGAPLGGSSGTPGVVDTASGPVAAAVLAAYVAVPLLVALAVFRRRDVT